MGVGVVQIVSIEYQTTYVKSKNHLENHNDIENKSQSITVKLWSVTVIARVQD